MSRTNSQIFNEALIVAQKNGYDGLDKIEYKAFLDAYPEPLEGMILKMVQGIIFSPHFAQCFFGTEEVDEYGYTFARIELWAKQVAVEFNGKLYTPPNNRREMSFINQPVIDMKTTVEKATAPTELVQGEIVTKKLEDMFAAIPIKTHRLKDLRVVSGIQAWQYHLREMVMEADPFKYLEEYMKKDEDKDEPTLNKKSRSKRTQTPKGK